MIDHALAQSHGMFMSREIPGQGHCAVSRFVFTTGLCTHLRMDHSGCFYNARYCYADWRDAIHAIFTWDGVGDPPGRWIKEKISERLGPGADVSDAERAAYEEARQKRLAIDRSR